MSRDRNQELFNIFNRIDPDDNRRNNNRDAERFFARGFIRDDDDDADPIEIEGTIFRRRREREKEKCCCEKRKCCCECNSCCNRNHC